jgi:hypothetical protein
VHYANGRIFGWVAQAGEPHAGYPGRNLTIESLGELDMTHFLRARFRLDDGSEIRAGAFTMNAPHHRDGAECESAACQFDDSRTVAGIVTVGMSERGLWFAGAAAPWLSEWDRKVFAACQPSYHMKQGSDGRWQLRAVLSVPVPGHSSPLLATAAAVAERSNLALAASAAADLADLAGPASGHDADTSADTADAQPDSADSGADTATTYTGTPRWPAGGQGGHHPDTGPDRRVRASSGAALAGLDVDQVATSLLTSVPFLETLLTAMDRLAEQRDTTRREAAELAASVVAPARAELAASHTTTSTEEGGN